MRVKKYVIGTLIFTSLAKSSLAYCPPQYQETWVIPMFSNSTLVMNSALATVDAQLSALMKLNDQRVLSALAVLTKQKALSGNIISDTERKSTQQVANGLRILASFKYMRIARLDYGQEFGQGYNPCKISNERAELSTQNAKAMERVNDIVKNVYAASGKYTENSSESKQQILRDISNYCTSDHVDSGLCKTVGKYPGLALNASIMFTADGVGNEFDSARKTFINTVVGIPDTAVPNTEARSPEAQEYVLQKHEKDALISPAITVLANLQSNYSSIDKARPVMSQYKIQAKRYFGDSQENLKWNKVLTAQTERGLLVEQLKIKALALSLQAKQYKENELMEMQIATLLAQEIRKNELLTRSIKINKARSDEDTIKQSIK